MENKNNLEIPDIRNKLSPLTHLISMVEIGEFDEAKKCLNQCKKSINYLSNRKVYKNEIS